MSARLGTQRGQELSPAKRLAFKALAVTLSLLVCFACLEIALRLFGPEYFEFNNLSKFYYSNPRGYFDVGGIEDGRVVYTVPVLGAGSPARRYPESLEAIADIKAFLAREDTVLGLGDSFTAGRGVRYEHTYLRRLEKMLARDGKPVTIRNTGSSGYDLEHIRAVYHVHSAPGRYPLVLYGFVLNDFGLPGLDKIVGSDYIDMNNGGYRYNVWRSRCALLNFVYHLVDRIRLDRFTRRAYLEAFRGQNATENFEKLSELNRRIEADGGRLVIVLFPLLYDFDDYDFHEIHDRVAEFAQREGIPMLDLLPAYSRYKAEDLWVHPTDHHPNEIAHRIAAEEIHAFLDREGLLDLLPSD